MRFSDAPRLPGSQAPRLLRSFLCRSHSLKHGETRRTPPLTTANGNATASRQIVRPAGSPNATGTREARLV